MSICDSAGQFTTCWPCPAPFVADATGSTVCLPNWISHLQLFRLACHLACKTSKVGSPDSRPCGLQTLRPRGRCCSLPEGVVAGTDLGNCPGGPCCHCTVIDSSSTAKYKYVSWRPARKRWLAHVPAYTSVDGLKFFKHYASKEAAIKAASKSSGVPRSSMLVGEDQHSGPGNFSVHNVRCRKRKLFRVMWHVYSHNSSSRQRCTVVPGDLCASLTHYTRSAKMFAADPGLLVCSLRGKEAAWKDAMLRNWKKHQPRNIRGVFSMLQDALRDMASAKARATTAVWQAHINRNVTWFRMHCRYWPRLMFSVLVFWCWASWTITTSSHRSHRNSSRHTSHSGRKVPS